MTKTFIVSQGKTKISVSDITAVGFVDFGADGTPILERQRALYIEGYSPANNNFRYGGIIWCKDKVPETEDELNLLIYEEWDVNPDALKSIVFTD